MILGLVNNISLLVALAVGAQIVARHLSKSPGVDVAAGLFAGLVAVIGMMTPFVVAPGVIYDGRAIVLAFAGLCCGALPTAVAALVAAVYRLQLGGPGAVAGASVVVASAALGLGLRHLRRRDERWVGVPGLVGFGAVLALSMLALQWLIPGIDRPALMRAIGPTALLAYPIAFAMLALFFLETERTVKREAALAATEERLRLALEGGDLGTWDWRATGEVVYDERWAAMLGYDLAQLEPRPETCTALLHPDDAQRVSAEFEAHLQGRSASYEAEQRLRHRDGHFLWVLSRGRVIERDAEGKPLRACGTMLDLSRHKEAEEALHHSEARNRALIEALPDLVFRISRDAVFHDVVAKDPAQLAAPRNAVLGRSADQVLPAHLARQLRERIAATHATGRMQLYHYAIEVGAAERLYEARMVPCGQDEVLVISRDVTEQRALEEQLRQVQKLESVGQLAGGIAHDFNNMLGVILGHLELALDALGPGEPLRGDLEEIGKAAERSADLTRQLLAFARRQNVVPQDVDLDEAIGTMLKMLRPLVGENVELSFAPSEDALWLRIDPSQLDQVLTNLVVNARDALDGAGRISIRTGLLDLAPGDERAVAGVAPGHYVTLEVEDDGRGMDEETATHVFEPFFTTKEKGRGTGLGLATVYGIVRQNAGFVGVESRPGEGACFRILLPRLEAAPAPAPRAEEKAREPAPGTGTLLLVEDEPALLELTGRKLRLLGYATLAATTPREALALAAAHPGPIDALVTDVVMPEMDGRALWTEVARLRPGIPCLLMSGYAEEAVVDVASLAPPLYFIAKPFDGHHLAAKVGEILEAARGPAQPPAGT